MPPARVGIGPPYFDAPAEEPLEAAPEPAAEAPLEAPLSPPVATQSRPVALSLPFRQFALAPDGLDLFERADGVAGVAGIADASLLREAGVAGVAGVAAFGLRESLLATLPFVDFVDFFDLSVEVSVEGSGVVSVLLSVVLPFAVVVLAEDVVSAEGELLLIELLGAVLSVPALVLPVELPMPDVVLPSVDALPLTLPDVVLDGAVAELVVEVLDFALWRSPIARALALPRANTEIKNTGASLRIWVSFRFIGFRERFWDGLQPLAAIGVPTC